MEEFNLKANKKVYYAGSVQFDRYITSKYADASIEEAERELRKIAEKAWYGGCEEEISAELGYFALIETEGYEKANQYLAEMIEAGWLTLEDVA